MHAQVIDNGTAGLSDVLGPLIQNATDVKMAVAFASRDGIALLRPSLDAALANAAHVEFLVGLDMHGTETNALRDLFDLSKDSGNAALYCYLSSSSGTIYHPKIYLARAYDESSVVIGSSNLTRGGLKSNIEANVLLKGAFLDETIAGAYEVYDRLKFMGGRVEPDEELLSIYGELCAEASTIRKAAAQGKIRELTGRLKGKFQTLHPPERKRSDLFGWLEAVYDALPDGQFTNEDIYRQKDSFLKYYPDNKNVEAKIRQQLQVLRNLGFIAHLDKGLWQRL
jgi:HKD family nuclease